VKKIAIIGFGALGRQILGLLDPARGRGQVVLFDDVLYSKRGENSFPFESFLDERFADCDFYVGLGYLHLPRKAEILGQLRTAGRRMPSFVHPSCHVHPTCRVGDGCLLYPCCNLDQEVNLGHGVLLNNSVVVSHNSHVGDAAYLSPGVVLSGRVTVADAAFLGSGTIVSNQRRIGARARVGIGTVVTRDVPDGASAIGNPVRLLERPLELE
jgi:sugar O-acyltransferase (sialic acid O-acetyltransferase NeuD family)